MQGSYVYVFVNTSATLVFILLGSVYEPHPLQIFSVTFNTVKIGDGIVIFDSCVGLPHMSVLCNGNLHIEVTKV